MRRNRVPEDCKHKSSRRRRCCSCALSRRIQTYLCVYVRVKRENLPGRLRSRHQICRHASRAPGRLSLSGSRNNSIVAAPWKKGKEDETGKNKKHSAALKMEERARKEAGSDKIGGNLFHLFHLCAPRFRALPRISPSLSLPCVFERLSFSVFFQCRNNLCSAHFASNAFFFFSFCLEVTRVHFRIAALL